MKNFANILEIFVDRNFYSYKMLPSAGQNNKCRISATLLLNSRHAKNRIGFFACLNEVRHYHSVLAFILEYFAS